MQTQWNSPPWSFVTSFTNYLAPHISCNKPTAVHERDDFLQLLSFMIFIFITIITIIIIAVPMSYFPTMIGDFHRFRESVLSDFTATDGRRNSANLLVIESLPYQKKTSAFFFSVYFSCVKSAKLSHPSACQSIHQSINQSINRLPGLRLSERNEAHPLLHIDKSESLDWERYNSAEVHVKCTRNTTRKSWKHPTQRKQHSSTRQQLVANQPTLLPDAENRHKF